MPRAQTAAAAAASLLACLCLLASPTSAVDLRGSAARQPTRYLSFGILGDLTNQWECILNAGMLAAKMAKLQPQPMALVVPGIYRTANGRFDDVYNLEHFKDYLKTLGVDVVEDVPGGVQQVYLSTVQGQDLNGYVDSWSSMLAQHKGQDVHYAISGGPNLSWETNEARHLDQCKKKYDLCGPMFENLQYTPQIKSMSKRILNKLNEGGEWWAVHVHDGTSWLCHGSFDDEIRKVGERLVKHNVKPKQLYIVGATRDLQHISDILHMNGVNLINKQSLLGADADHLQFQESAAVDQGVVREAAFYLTKPGSSFDDLANSIRQMSGKEKATVALPRTWQGCEQEEMEAAKKQAEAQASGLEAKAQ